MANEDPQGTSSGSQKISSSDLQNIQLSLKSAHEAISKIIAGPAKIGGTSPLAVFDRGFDRTSGGYDKYYDRDRNMASIKDQVTNPATNPVVNPGKLNPGNLDSPE